MPHLVAFFLMPVVFLGGAALFHRHRREVVHERLRKVARRRGGRMGKAWWILYPRLVVDLEGAEVQVSAMHGGKHSRARTFAWLGCGHYPAVELEARRSPAGGGLLERMGRERARSGDPGFDAVFRLAVDEPEIAARIVDRDVREALLAFDESLAVSLRIGTAPAYRDGMMRAGEQEPRVDISIRRLPAEVEDVERLLDLATLVHTRLMQAREGIRAAG